MIGTRPDDRRLDINKHLSVVEARQNGTNEEYLHAKTDYNNIKTIDSNMTNNDIKTYGKYYNISRNDTNIFELANKRSTSKYIGYGIIALIICLLIYVFYREWVHLEEEPRQKEKDLDKDGLLIYV